MRSPYGGCPGARHVRASALLGGGCCRQFPTAILDPERWDLLRLQCAVDQLSILFEPRVRAVLRGIAAHANRPQIEVRHLHQRDSKDILFVSLYAARYVSLQQPRANTLARWVLGEWLIRIGVPYQWIVTLIMSPRATSVRSTSNVIPFRSLQQLSPRTEEEPAKPDSTNTNAIANVRRYPPSSIPKVKYHLFTFMAVPPIPKRLRLNT